MSRPTLLVAVLVVALTLALAAVAYSQAGIATPPGAAPAATPADPPTAITSGGSPSAPVPFLWSLHESHRPDGHRLLTQGGTIHALADEVRLLNPAGQVVAQATAQPLAADDSGLCDQRRGLVRADLPLPAADLRAFGAEWPAGYRLEARVGGVWRPTTPTFAGCLTIE